MLIATVNQDPGVRPGADKGAAVHVEAMRRAFAACGAEVLAVDEKDDAGVRAALAGAGPIDLVYERYALGCGEAGRFARDAGVPHVLEVNAPLLDEAVAHRGAVDDDATRRRERQILGRATELVAVSRPVGEWLRAQGVDDARILVRPNGVDTERFHPGLRRRDDRAFVLGFHGRLRPWHAFEDLARVFARLVDRGLPVRLEVVGRGDFEAVLAPLVPTHTYAVTPWVDPAEVGRHVARFDALALTHRADGPPYFSPLKLLEAMAVGAVPVVPDLGDLPSVVEHGRTGLVYPAGDLGVLEELLATLVARPELAAELGAAAVRSARRRTWRALAEELMGRALAARAAAS